MKIRCGLCGKKFSVGFVGWRYAWLAHWPDGRHTMQDG